MAVEPLSFHISVFTASGLWLPAEWTSNWRRILYYSYSFLIIGLISFLCLLQSVEAFTSMGKVDELVETLYILSAGFNLSYKAFNIVTKHKDIVKLLSLPKSKTCQILSYEEKAFRSKYHRRIRNSTILLCAVLEGTVANMIISSIFANIPERTFPVKVWLPLNCTEGYKYWTIYCSQLIGFTYAGTFHVFYDTFIIGIMITLCGQLQIFQYRNSIMSSSCYEYETHLNGAITEVDGCYEAHRSTIERKLIIKTIEHYDLLLQFAKSFNGIIFYVIFVQYSISCLIVCLSVYRLVNMSFSDPAYIFTIFYCGTVTIQTFAYCWFGNEVIVESSNISASLYNSNWYSFDVATLKDFTIMLHRMQNSMEFSCTRLFVLSIDSFKNIMKMTYSGLNLLMQSS